MKRLIYILFIAAVAFTCAPEELESEVLVTDVGVPIGVPTIKIIESALLTHHLM